MEPENQIKAVQAWQNNLLVHPITCGNNSSHRILFAEKSPDGPVVLKCPDCSYAQYNIPDPVLLAYEQKGFHQNDKCGVLECQKPITRDTYQIWMSGGRIIPVCKECVKKLQSGTNQNFSMGCKLKEDLPNR